MPVLQTIITAVITFIATNIDDIFVLMMFFAQSNPLFRRRHIIVGQYLGFMALVAISLLGFLGSMLIPREYIGLLGLIPIGIGIHKFIYKEDTAAPIPHSLNEATVSSIWNVLFHPKTYSVAAVTFANGGDNLGIYTPLFASMNLLQLINTLAVFLLLVLLWCILGIRLAGQTNIARVLSQYGHWLIPIVLIGLGIFIIIENGTPGLLGL